MDYHTDRDTPDVSFRGQFLTSLDENIRTVVDSLQVISTECEMTGDLAAARFAKAVASAISAFASVHRPTRPTKRYAPRA